MTRSTMPSIFVRDVRRLAVEERVEGVDDLGLQLPQARMSWSISSRARLARERPWTVAAASAA